VRDCPECLEENHAEARFCHSCGARLDSNAEVPGVRGRIGRLRAKVRRRLSGLRREAIVLAAIVGTLSALSGPGIIAKLLGLAGVALAGADPALQLGVVIFQTAPLTLAIAILAVVYTKAPLDRWPFNTLGFVAGCCIAVLVATTTAANRAGLESGVSLEHVREDAPDLPVLIGWPVSFAREYLAAYGVSAFVSAIVIGIFLARWYFRFAVRGGPSFAILTGTVTALSGSVARLAIDDGSERVVHRPEMLDIDVGTPVTIIDTGDGQPIYHWGE
jgi:hypothetical protein